MIQDIEKEVNDIWYHLRGNGEVGLLEQTRRNTDTLESLKTDVSTVKKMVYEMKEERIAQAGELRGMRRAFTITLAAFTILGGTGGAWVVRLLTDIVNALQ